MQAFFYSDYTNKNAGVDFLSYKTLQELTCCHNAPESCQVESLSQNLREVIPYQMFILIFIRKEQRYLF